MKFKKIISFVVCLLVLLNIPGILLETQSIAVSSPVSYFTFFLLGVLIITNKTKFPKQILFMAGISSLYFFIGAFQYEESFITLSSKYVKFLLYLFGLFVSLKHINQNTIIFLLLAGAITILLDSLYFRFNDFQGIDYVSQYGRYSGFYLNPNTASMICLTGYALSITKTNYWKFLSIAFTFFGFLTLSRTFMASWFLITIIYLFYNRKYIVKTLLFLIVSVFSLITFSEKLNLDVARFDFLVNLFSGQINNEFLNKDSRQDQWAKFYDGILNSPIIGNGYSSFGQSLDGLGDAGVHNSFLLIIGESGLLPFLLIIMIFFFLFKKSYNLRKKNLTFLLLMFVLFIQFLVSHNFFDSGLMLFVFLNIIYLLNFNYNKRII